MASGGPHPRAGCCALVFFGGTDEVPAGALASSEGVGGLDGWIGVEAAGEGGMGGLCDAVERRFLRGWGGGKGSVLIVLEFVRCGRLCGCGRIEMM